MKTCYRCKKDKTFEEFFRDKKSKLNCSSYCRECAKTNSKEWYIKSESYRQTVRNSGLKNRFGITSDDYFRMLEDQDGVCAICKLKYDKYLHVDHSHETGEIRGLLCKMCNNGLGNFKDNPEYLKSAINYIDRNSVSN